MDFRPDTSQSHLLLRMLVTGEQPPQSQTRPALRRAQRDELVTQGLVALERRGRSDHLVLTDTAWRWAASNLALLATPRLKLAPDLLAALLSRMQAWLDQTETTLDDLLGRDGEESALAGTGPGLKGEALEEAVLDGYLQLTSGRRGPDVRLADLRRQLRPLDRDVVDSVLERMAAGGAIRILPEDGRESADNDAAILIEGRRHDRLCIPD